MAANPVTFRATLDDYQSPVCVTVARMHLGYENEPLQKLVPITVWEEDPEKRMTDEGVKKVLANVILDEDHFLNGLRHLFPDFEITRRRK